MADDVDVLLYGATGYTGRLIADELQALGLSFCIAGRSESKLQTLADELGQVPYQAIPVSDEAALERAARHAKVVVSAAGPFMRLGPPVVRAAVAAGTHFIDITGEQPYLRWCLGMDEAAQDAGVTVVNAFGFDVVPSEIAALLSTTAMRRVRHLDIGIRVRMQTSSGTLRSMAEASGQGGYHHEGQYEAVTPYRWRRDFAFPAPTGQRPGVSVPWGDVVTAPRATGAENVRTFFCLPQKQVRLLHGIWPLTGGLLRSPLARWSLQRAAARHQDPTPEARRNGRFEILAEAIDEDGVMQRGHVSGRDPYGLTGALAAYGAKGLIDGAAPRGVCTPTQAFRFGPLAEAMAPRFDLKWRARSLDPVESGV